jgi:hypothetical protein
MNIRSPEAERTRHVLDRGAAIAGHGVCLPAAEARGRGGTASGHQRFTHIVQQQEAYR